MTVFTGSRITTNNVFGTLTDNPLLIGATTMNAAGLTNLAAVASNHAVIILDPLRAAGAPEIVIVSAHTGAATSATIIRGQYGTAARQHLSGVLWVHAPTIDDVIRIATSGARPADQYEGQVIYETDTDSYKGHNGTAWEQIVTLGAWTAYTPTLGGSTLGNGTIAGSYVKAGRTVFWKARFVYGSTSVVAAATTMTLPVTSVAVTNIAAPIGNVTLFDTSATANYLGVARHASTTTTQIRSLGTLSIHTDLSSASPFTWATGDEMVVNGVYEAAA